MTLKQKFLTSTILVITVLMLIVLWFSQYITQIGFRGVEEQKVHIDVKRALGFVDANIAELSSKTLDYAAWDDTYEFVRNKQPSYVRKNFNRETLMAQKLNLVMIMDTAGKTVYETGFDHKSFFFTDVPEILKDFAYIKRLLASAQKMRTLNGITILDENPMLISIQPILKSNLNGPSRGFLIMGRSLGAESFLRLSQVAHQNFQLLRFNDDRLPPDIQQRLNTSKSILVKPLSEGTIGGYGRIDDIFGQPSLILCVMDSRPIYQQLMLTIEYMFVFLLIAGVVFILIFLFLFDLLVVKRLSRMSKELLAISNSNLPGCRFLVSGKDELSVLGKRMNTMIEKIESTETLLRTEAAIYRAVVQDQAELICRYLPDGTLTFVNDSYCRYYGNKQSDLLGSNIFATVCEKDREHVERCRQSLNWENLTITYEYRVSLADGRIRWQRTTERLIPNEVGQPLEFQSVIRDITDSLQTKESLRNAYAELDLRVQEQTFELRQRDEQLNTAVVKRVRIEDILRTSEKKYMSIINNVRIGIIMLNREMNVVVANRQIKEWFPDLSLLSSCAFVTGEHKNGDTKEVLYPASATFRDGQVHEAEYQIRVGDEYRLFHIVSYAVKDVNESVENVFEMLNDITESRRVEESLYISETRYRGIVEDQTELMCRMTPDGCLTFVNEAYHVYFGENSDEIIGKYFLSFIYYEDRQNFWDAMAYLNPIRTVISFTCRVILGSGEIRWQRWTTRGIYSKKNYLWEYQAVGQNISGRNQIDEILQGKQRKLDEKSGSPEGSNAMRIISKHEDENGKEVEVRVLSNINELVMPYVDKLKTAPLDKRYKTCLDIIEANLRDIRSEFTGRLISGAYNLTSKELLVANLIREGKTTKEIAELLCVSSNTIDFHRNNIRKKLGITNEKVNLHAYLAQLS